MICHTFKEAILAQNKYLSLLLTQSTFIYYQRQWMMICGQPRQPEQIRQSSLHGWPIQLSVQVIISQSAELTQYSDLKCSCFAISFPCTVEKNGFSNASNESSCSSNHACKAGRAGTMEELWKPDI